VGRWDQNGSEGDWLGGCGLDSTGSGQGPVAGCFVCGDEPSGSCATELVSYGTSSCTSHPYEGVLRTFIALKKSIALAGFEPATLGSSGEHTNHYTTEVTL
jgi:hypothetical protein